MHHRAAGTTQRFVGALDQIFAGLGQYLDGHVVGNAVFFDQCAHEIEIRLRCRRESHFDFLEADFHQQGEQAFLFLHVHRVDQRLVAVAQVNTAPDGRGVDDLIWPGAIP